GGLECHVVRGFGGSGATDPRTDALTHDRNIASAHLDAPLGRVETPRLSALLSLPDAARRYRLPVPALVAEDAVGLGDGVPALDIPKGGGIAGTHAYVAIAQLGVQGLALFMGKCHHLVLTLSCNCGGAH